MNNQIRVLRPLGVLCAFLVACVSVSAEPLKLSLSVEVGSWQLRRDTTTDEKGKQTIHEVRSSVVGAEKREGKDMLWTEMVMQQYSVDRKGNQKKSGDLTIMKVLVDKSVFSGDPAKAWNNLRGIGSEIIFQSGDGDPMLISGGNMMADGMLKAMGTEINYDFKSGGKERVTVPAGDFDCELVEGSGSVEMRILMRTSRVNSQTRQWFSSKVPFGVVRMVTESETNGKVSTMDSVLLEYGNSGATSLITKTPQEMPKLPFFGG